MKRNNVIPATTLTTKRLTHKINQYIQRSIAAGLLTHDDVALTGWQSAQRSRARRSEGFQVHFVHAPDFFVAESG
jgi:hypothetical protein